MGLILISLIAVPALSVDSYRFEGGYTEVWYQVSVQSLFSPEELQSTPPKTLSKRYTFRFDVYNEEKSDSAHIEGIKEVHVAPGQQKHYLIDFLPVTLYPGSFSYNFEIESDGKRMLSRGEIEIPPDTVLLSCSDLILGRKDLRSEFIFHEHAFTPSIALEFVRHQMLFSYLEIYGLVPDSLYYKVKYKIINSMNDIVFEKKDKRLKYAYVQVDTFTVALANFIEGDYTFEIEVFDSALNRVVSRTKDFKISTPVVEAAGRKFYYDIYYIVTPGEYKKFLDLNEYEKKVYLEEFWSKRDYWEFERRLLETDAQFSTGVLKGRDSERGRFYIKNGPPDDIEIVPMADWARPFEVWHYFSGGYDVLFSDTKDDGNPRLVKIFKSGELTEILEKGFREGEADEDWLFDIAPGAYPVLEREEEEEGPEVMHE